MKPKATASSPASASLRTKVAPARGAQAPKEGPVPGTGVPRRYGPAGANAWTLEAGRVSLLRKAAHPRVLRLAAEPLPLELDAARSALVVIDMQNDFCHPDGWFGQKGISVQPMRKPIPVIARLLPAWRRAGGTVVWLNWGVRPDARNLSPTLHFKSRYSVAADRDTPGYAERSPRDRGRAVVAGDWGAQVVDGLTVAPGDLIVHKHRLSGFWDNELDSVLRQSGITTLLFAGVNTDRCVFSTLQDAGFLGYDCVLLADACNTPSPGYVTRAIHFIVRQLHGFTAQSADLLDAIAAPAPKPSRKKPRKP